MPERSGRSRRNDALMRAFLSFSFRAGRCCRFSRSGWELTQADRHRPPRTPKLPASSHAPMRGWLSIITIRYSSARPRHALPGDHRAARSGASGPIAQSNGVLAHDVHHMPKTIGDDECCIWGDDCHLGALMRLRRMGTPCR
jgi:hypothetical protein